MWNFWISFRPIFNDLVTAALIGLAGYLTHAWKKHNATTRQEQVEIRKDILKVGILSAIQREDTIAVVEQYKLYKSLGGNSYISKKVKEYYKKHNIQE